MTQEEQKMIKTDSMLRYIIASIDTMDLFLRQIQRAKFLGLGSQERNPWYQAPRQ
jgi:hypothetical protein